jgi:hypothetical protein
MFASNFIAADDHLRHLRGRDNMTTYTQSKTIETGNTMTNYFCKTCGTLMYRVSSGWPGQSILRIGTIEDFKLMETKLKPRVEQYVRYRLNWVNGMEGIKQVEGNSFPKNK